ncbi:hypothetical protein HQ584_00445, partial [Patescibacteria group bacterium]|nr:hypothetical protein [Patescibacteria group bacterium]
MRIDDTIVDIRPQWVPWDKDLCLCLNGNDWQMFQRKSENNKALSIERNVMDYDTEYNIISTRTKKFQSYAKDKNAVARLFFDMMKIKKQKEWMFCSVPGSVQTAILENEKAPVPIYHSLNIQSLQTSTINKESWFYKSFQVPLAWKSKILRLHFEAVDYEADFFLNGNYIGSHVGHFSPAEFEVSKYVKFRDYNEILLRIHPFPEDRSRTARSAIFKNQITDNTPAVCPLGISDDVYLIASDRLYIKDLCIRTKLNKDFSTAEIQFQLSINSEYSLKTEVEYLIRSQQNNQSTHLKKAKVIDYGESELYECIFLTDPQLWWPNGSGPQNIYVADVIIRDSEASILEKYSAKFGIRKLEMDFNEGAKEIPFPWTFVINGKKIYFKGAG